MKALLNSDSRKYSRVFWLFASLHLLLWTLIPWLVSPNAPLDVIEGYGWGNEWVIGTYKHPPMQAWLLQVAALITGKASWAHLLLSQVAIVIAFWAIWQTGRRITNETNALLGVMLLEGIIYFNFTSPEFNPNVLQTCFWALIGWLFHRAVKDNRMADWTMLGIFSAGAVYSKYSALLFLAILTALLIAHPYSRRRLKGYGPYLSLTIILSLLSPHIIWLFNHDFQPFTYAESRTEISTNIWQRINWTLGFIGSQLLAIGAATAMFFVLTKGRIKRSSINNASSFDYAFLNTITLAPIAALLALSLLIGVKMRGMWGASLWGFIALWAVVNFEHCMNKDFLRSFYKIWSTVFILTLFVYATKTIATPAVTDRILRVQFPGKIMAEEITNKWNALYGIPLEYAIGDTWLAGNLAYYAPTAPRPHVFIKGDPSINNWVDPNDIKNKGGIIVWGSEHCYDQHIAQSIPLYLKELFPTAELQQPLTIAWQTRYPVSPAVVGWAVVPPQVK